MCNNSIERNFELKLSMNLKFILRHFFQNLSPPSHLKLCIYNFVDAIYIHDTLNLESKLIVYYS